MAVKGVSCVKALEFVDGKLIEAGYRIPGANPEEYLKTAYHFRQIAGWGDSLAWIHLYERDVMYDWFPSKFIAVSGIGDAYAIVTCADLLGLMRHLLLVSLLVVGCGPSNDRECNSGSTDVLSDRELRRPPAFS